MFNFLSRKPYRLGVAFSGGGARGFAHAGAIKALNEFGLKPDIVAGVSAGSVVAALYASGMAPEKMLEIFQDMKFSDFCALSVPKCGFFKLDGFKKFLAANIPHKTIEELPVPTVICATDIDNSRPAAFESGPLTECIAASCSMPIVFSPVKIGGVRYLDGGLLHNLPAWAIRERCKYLIGLNCSPMPRRRYGNSIMEMAHLSYNLTVKTNTVADMELCDLAVDMQEIASYKVFNLKQIRKVFRQGYAMTVKALLQAGYELPASKTQQ